MTEKERKYILLMIAMLFVGLAAYYYVYLIPIQNEAQQLRAQVELANSQTQSALKRVEVKETTPPQEQLTKIAELLPVQPYTDQLIIDFGKLQTLGGVEIQNVTFNSENEVNIKELAGKFIPPEVKDGKVTLPKENKPINIQGIQNSLPQTTIKSIEMTLSVKGEYKNIYKFVSEIQDLSRYLRVDSLSFGSPEKDEFQTPKEKATIVSMKLTTYYAPQYAVLLDKLPSVITEKPSGKWDPTQYPVIKKEDMDKQNQNITKQNQ
jgi:Tfp pilus assembly protein PilO